MLETHSSSGRICGRGKRVNASGQRTWSELGKWGIGLLTWSASFPVVTKSFNLKHDFVYFSTVTTCPAEYAQHLFHTANMLLHQSPNLLKDPFPAFFICSRTPCILHFLQRYGVLLLCRHLMPKESIILPLPFVLSNYFMSKCWN